MGYDRNEVLGRTDLGELADQLVGPHKGRGAGATWPCPDPGHGIQTGIGLRGNLLAIFLSGRS